jgi:poly-gamma-glutamate synthesis protein (capsule biosynthesis protein)
MNLIRCLIFSMLLCAIQPLNAQEAFKADTVSLLFMGDIMGHKGVIDAAQSKDSLSYDFNPMFRYVSPMIQSADFALANLEVTLAGPPYTGYPRFSSPDALAAGAQQAGIDVLFTANNHSYDYGTKGLQRTIKVLDSLKIMHTGSFASTETRETNNLLILTKGKIRLGVLNYTYGVNGRTVHSPSIINKIDLVQMKKDITQALIEKPDKLIVVLHWGKEYEHTPDPAQQQIANFLFTQGVDIIIGAHPHVVQPMAYQSDVSGRNERFIAYSMGNFLSDQRKPGRDGGAMISLKLVKIGDECRIIDQGFHLTWVYKPIIAGKRAYRILPIRAYEQKDFKGVSLYSQEKMKAFAKTTRLWLEQMNRGVYESGTAYQEAITLLNQYRMEYALQQIREEK